MGQCWDAYLAPARNPERAERNATNSAYWAATYASWSLKSKAQPSKATEAARRTVHVSRRAVLLRVDLLTDIQPSLCTQIQIDADFLLATLQAMVDLWESTPEGVTFTIPSPETLPPGRG